MRLLHTPCMAKIKDPQTKCGQERVTTEPLTRAGRNITCYNQHFRKHLGMLLLLLSRFSRVQLCDPRDGSPPGSSAHGILQARVLEWGAIAFSDILA